ncbi:hypothetical protein KPH14_000686, partial [Odynerus spinipes]
HEDSLGDMVDGDVKNIRSY